ncbi:DUF2064 domain-containing protein [Nonomuraea sp. M3C6]|uniref:DUF2064 domain-containing protein n=1 Tax=Nonomuraea marmarensis TaxID=3351344 RepID=A0ABW7A5X1_9ACTN
MNNRTQIVVLKRPRPGRVKTRLTPPYTPAEAAEPAAAALDDTLDAVAATPAAARVLAIDDLLTQAAAALEEHEAVFGPATDGGFWLLGLRRPDPALLLGVPMSRPDTGEAQLRRLRGLSVATLPPLTDVDDAADAREVAGLAPHTRFAATLARLGAGAVR